MEHLKLEIFDLPTPEDPKGMNSRFATLPEDATVTITDTSEVFASGDVWSHSFTLSAAANAHILGTVADLHGSRLHDLLDRRKARLWVEDIPLYMGYIRLDDEAEVDEDGNVDVRFESGQKTFEDMIDGAKANQVPMMGKVRFGVALWRKRSVSVWLKLVASVTFKDGKTSSPKWVTHTPHQGVIPGDVDEETTPFFGDGENDNAPVQEYPRMVFPKGTFTDVSTHEDVPVDDVNTDNPYTEDANGTPTYPYCNVALCYQKYGYDRKNDKDEIYPDYESEPEAQRGYEVMPADRVNSAPNFYVIYWIRSLMKHLGIHVDENQMMGVEDLRRLFFVNTRCAYEEPKHIRTPDFDRTVGRYFFKGARLVPEMFGVKDGDRWNGQVKLIKPDACAFTASGTVYDIGYSPTGFTPYSTPEVDHVTVDVREVEGMTDAAKQAYENDNSYLHDAYASSECFPDVDISEVIKAIESGFGVRFLFSDDYKRVRIVLLRNLFRSTDIQDIECDIIAPDTKMENSIRGFRMTYGKGTDDTHFYYKGFADLLPHRKPYFVDNSDKHDYSKWKLNEIYEDLLSRVSAFNKTCYVTPATGNAYGIKIDKDAKRYQELHPSLFGYADFMDAEDGDCTGEDETIEEVSVGFTPAIMNDLNMEEERKGSRNQRFALFVSETMRPRRADYTEEGTDFNDPEAVYQVDTTNGNDGLYGDMSTAKKMTAGDGIVKPGEFAITSDIFAAATDLKADFEYELNGTYWDGHSLKPTRGKMTGKIKDISIDGHANEGYRLYLQDNYEPNDDGVSPIETHDWGLTLGIMRGSGSDARVVYGPDPQENPDEGNDTWELESGSSVTAHPDTCDNYGNKWSYNEQTERIVDTQAGAVQELSLQFPNSNAPFHKDGPDGGYITRASVVGPLPDNTGKLHSYLIVNQYGSYGVNYGDRYIPSWIGKSVSEVLAMDRADKRIIVEVDSSQERCDTLLQLCHIAAFGTSTPMIIDNGVGSQFGRFSLKLRAEKLNPYFDPTKEENNTDNRRYLEIDDPNLRGRGLIDQFYKEYSYWVRNARIAKRTVRMTLAQLLAIDKTKRVRVGDITGFIRKTQYSVSNKTGLGMVEMEIMYI